MIISNNGDTPKNIDFSGLRLGSVVHVPIEQAWNMRKNGSGTGSMEQKRTNSTMDKMRVSMRNGSPEPINATELELKGNRLQDGKHRLIIAKEFGMKTYPIKIT
jgi:hypothetical protein